MTFDRGKYLEICRSKRWYETREAAISAMTDMADIFGTKNYVYECAFCHLFHLTSRPPKAEAQTYLVEQEQKYRASVKKRRD